MRHGAAHRKLGRTTAHRHAMLSNMASSLIMFKRLTTTVAKAKALRKYVEPLLTKSKDDTTTVDEARRVATRQRPGKTPQTANVPKPVFDPLSLVYHLRSLDLKPGSVQKFTIYADGKTYTLEANVDHTETIGTPAGTFHTVVVQPKTTAGTIFKDEGSMTIWFTDDARHIPVRIRSELKFGSITANLRSIRAGASDPEPPTGR